MQRLADLEGINGLEFHDALIGDVRYSAEDRNLSVGLSIYETMASGGRTPAFLSVQSMDRATVRMDFPKLASNAFAGTVMNCRVDTEENVARLYLCGGLLEVASKSQSLEPSELPPSVFNGHEGNVLAGSFRDLETWDLAFSVLSNIEVSTNTARCTIALQLPSGEGVSERRGAVLRLSRCTSCVLTLDGRNLSRPEGRYGNVQNVHVDARRGIVWLYLQDGLIEVRARAAELVAR